MFSDPVEIKKAVEYEKMSEADKLFEELGYIKKESDYYYHSKEDQSEHKHIKFYKHTKEIIVESKLHFSYEITMQELKAINMKVKELRMGVIINDIKRSKNTP